MAKRKKKKTKQQIVKSLIQARNLAIKKSIKGYQNSFIYLSNVLSKEAEKINKAEKVFVIKDFLTDLEWKNYLRLTLGAQENMNSIAVESMGDFFATTYGYKKSVLQPIQNKTLAKLNKKIAAERVTNITNSTKNKLNRIITTSQAAGLNRKEIAKQLMETVDGMTKSRALTIARTETSTSTSIDNHDLLVSVGAKREWIHIGGGKNDREEHVAISGETVEGEEEYSIGLLHPHDPAADASDTVNCHCDEIMSI